MALFTHVKGALLEEVVLFLLAKVGYSTIDPSLLASAPQPGLRKGKSGLDARGRGTWHQLDALCNWDHSPAFIYPIRLIVEAKCYAQSSPIQVSVTRNALGVLKDVSENYFSFDANTDSVHGPRYNYVFAIFSTSGFTRGAVEFAIAHQIFLIQYEDVPVIAPVIDAIMELNDDHFESLANGAIAEARGLLRNALQGSTVAAEPEPTHLSVLGRNHILGAVRQAAEQIGGSYFGMLQGRWPMHLLRKTPLPEAAFREDTIHCRVISDNLDSWRFVPIGVSEDSARWFELEFSLPLQIARLVELERKDRVSIANLKQQHFSYINLTGIIGGIRRNLRLQLDEKWIRDYVQREIRRIRGRNVP